MQRPFFLRPLLATVAAAVAIAAGGCAEDGGMATDGEGTASEQVQTTADGAVLVSMKAVAYHPKHLTVRAGQRITWVNDDDVLHDVVSTDGEQIESELFPRGKSFSFTPTRPGTISYLCTIHPGMEGTITVE